MDVHENGPAPRCPECNHKGPATAPIAAPALTRAGR
jgi:hypothetical protein